MFAVLYENIMHVRLPYNVTGSYASSRDGTEPRVLRLSCLKA